MGHPMAACPHGLSHNVDSVKCHLCPCYSGKEGDFVLCNYDLFKKDKETTKTTETTVDRPEWEYLTIETAKPIGVKELDKRGSEGWMMCGTSYAGHFYYYFKRQKLS